MKFSTRTLKPFGKQHGGDTLYYKLSNKDIAAIEEAINKRGKTEANVKVEDGAVSVVEVYKKKIN